MSNQRSNYCDDCQAPDEEVCFSCWQANEREIIDTPAVKQAAKLIRDLRSFCIMGGNLHVQIEDMNLDDEFFDVRQILEYQRDEELDPSFETEADVVKRHQVERELFYLLRSMPLEERYSACELADECEVPVRNASQGYHDALTKQLREQVAASMVPDFGEPKKFL